MGLWFQRATLNWLKPIKRIFPDTTCRKFTPEFCKLRCNPTHFNKAFEDDSIDFRSKKSAHQPVHGAPMIIRHEGRPCERRTFSEAARRTIVGEIILPSFH